MMMKDRRDTLGDDKEHKEEDWKGRDEEFSPTAFMNFHQNDQRTHSVCISISGSVSYGKTKFIRFLPPSLHHITNH